MVSIAYVLPDMRGEIKVWLLSASKGTLTEVRMYQAD